MRVAGPVPRVCAWSIDALIRLILYLVLAFSLVLLVPSAIGQAIMALTIFASEWLYFALFEGLSGATPGKRRCGLMVVQRDGSPCGLEASFVRNIVRFVDFLPIPYGFGLLSVFASPDFQRLGDRAAGTLVVYGDPEGDGVGPTALRGAEWERKRRRSQRVETANKSVFPVEPMPVPVALTGEEEAAVLEFARRAPIWGEDRANELADLLEPMTHLKGDAGRQRLLQYAKWLEERGA